MPERFACEMIFGLNSLPHRDRFKFYGGKLVTNLIELEVDLERDVFMPIVMEHVTANPMEFQDGIYKVFIIGDVKLDERTSFDIPDDSDEWIFTETETIFTTLSTAPVLDKKGKITNYS